jgi:hypothetical protein
MNIYLAPLITELRNLWLHGVQAYDASQRAPFQLHAILIWTMHDYPGYRVCSSLQTQGIFACPPCGPYQLKGRKLISLRKVVYIGHMKYLPYGNTLRHHTNKRKFDNTNCDGTKPVRTTPVFWKDMWAKVQKPSRQGRQTGTGGSSSTQRPQGSVKLKHSGMKGNSIFQKLPYYKVIRS